MASPIPYSVADDNDLDDAALWAVIDTAAASHSSSKSRKPLAIKYPNFQPVSPISNPAPPTKFTRNPRTPNFADSDPRISAEGEVVQEPWIYRPPRKVARTCASVVSESSPLLVVRNVQRTPTTPAYSSPEANLSPDIERFGVKEISARSEGSTERCGWSEDLNMRHSLSGRFPSVSLFKEYQNAAMAILEKTDYTMISGNPFIKKSGWRKISFYFNLSFEIKDKTIEFDENRNVQRAEFVVRAYMQGGRFSDGWGSCERREKRFLKPNHDIPSTAETRAKNKACQLMRSIGGPGRSLPSVRGTIARRFVPYRCGARRPRGVRISEEHSPHLADEASSDDETQPPSQPWEPPCANPNLETEANREPSPRGAPEPDRFQNGEDVSSVPAATQAQTRRGRGPAKCTEFEKVRKHGKVLLKINNGETAPCCENANIFTARLSWIIKHHCNMSYPRWSDVPQAHKDELIDRVRADFELDWDLENHQLAVTKQLRKRFNAFHHQLHKIYMSFGSHDEALATGTSLVSPLIWFKLCERWGSEAFQQISSKNRENRKMLKINHTTGRKSFVRVLEQKRVENANLVDFYKETHWSKKKDKFVTPATEDIYKDMVGKLDTLEPDNRTNEAAAGVFREVLGHRPGYARGLGEMVIPESTRQRSLAREREYIALIEKHKKEAEASKSEMESMKANMQVMMERQNETDRMLRAIFAVYPSLSESLGETH